MREINEVDKVGQLKAEAEAGEAWAQFELGKRYADGRGVTQDAGKALQLFQRSAEQGYKVKFRNLLF